MITSIIAENVTVYSRRHLTKENNKQKFQQGLSLYPRGWR